MVYQVEVRDISIGYLNIEAASPKEAERIAFDEYDSGEMDWEDGDTEFFALEPPKETLKEEFARLLKETEEEAAEEEDRLRDKFPPEEAGEEELWT